MFIALHRVICMLMADFPVKGPAGNSFQGQWIYREELFDFTWSSRGSSQKAGMYFAHSTNTRSCCFMDSHTSLMVAIFFMAMSVLCTGLRDKYCERNPPAVFGADQRCFITLHSKDSSHSCCGWSLVPSSARGAASTRWCSVPTHTQPSSSSLPALQGWLRTKLTFPPLAGASSAVSQLLSNPPSQPNA